MKKRLYSLFFGLLVILQAVFINGHGSLSMVSLGHKNTVLMRDLSFKTKFLDHKSLGGPSKGFFGFMKKTGNKVRSWYRLNQETTIAASLIIGAGVLFALYKMYQNLPGTSQIPSIKFSDSKKLQDLLENFEVCEARLNQALEEYKEKPKWKEKSHYGDFCDLVKKKLDNHIIKDREMIHIESKVDQVVEELYSQV